VFILPSGLGFVSKSQDYFLEYDVSHIPYEFVERIGDIRNGLYEAEAFRNLAEGKSQIREYKSLFGSSQIKF
jgi:predicted transcriptional regulator